MLILPLPDLYVLIFVLPLEDELKCEIRFTLSLKNIYADFVNSEALSVMLFIQSKRRL
jgi:hypothetical protein